MYKLIACDLDETLLGADKTVSQANRDAIAKAGARGVKFVCATGRPFHSAHRTLKELGLFDKAGEYMISFNGGAITENRQEQLLHYQGLDFEKARKLFERAKPYDVCVHIYTLDTVWVWRLFDGEVDYCNGRMDIKEFFEDNIDWLEGTSIVKMLYVNTDRAYLQKIAADLQDLTQDLDVSYSSNRYLEFNPMGVNKGGGLENLARILGIDMSQTIAIGDNYNDLAMIQKAGLGVGVANTVETMKKECDFVTECTCEESAVAEVIEKFILSA